MFANKKISQSLLDKNPKYNKHQISLVIGAYLKSINKKMQNPTCNLSVPKFGLIHTHGNAKNPIIQERVNKQNKKAKIKGDFSDERLLF